MKTISRLEALEIARRVLEDAERERSECAARECRSGERCVCEEFDGWGGWIECSPAPMRFCPWCGKPVRKEGGE